MEGVSAASNFPTVALSGHPFVMRGFDVPSTSRGLSRRPTSSRIPSGGSWPVVIKPEPLSTSASPVPPPASDVTVKRETTGSPVVYDLIPPDGPSMSRLQPVESSETSILRKTAKYRSFSGNVPSTNASTAQAVLNGRHSALPQAFLTSPTSGNKSNLSSRDVQKVVLKNLGDGSVAAVNAILEQIGSLSDAEKAFLYSRLPDGQAGDEDPLKACANPLGSRFEISQTLSWISSHLMEDPEVSLQKKDVYDEYEEFCRRNCLKPLSTADFGKAMKQVFPQVKPRRLGVRGQSRYCYSGLRKKCGVPVPILPDLSRTGETPSSEVEQEREDAEVVTSWASKILHLNFRTVTDLAAHLIRSGGYTPRSPEKCASQASMKQKIQLSRSISNCPTPVMSSEMSPAALARHGRSFSGGCVKRSNSSVVVRTSGAIMAAPVNEGDLIVGQLNQTLGVTNKPANKLPIPKLRPVVTSSSDAGFVSRSCSSSPNRIHNRYVPIQPKPTVEELPPPTPALTSLASILAPPNVTLVAGVCCSKRPADSPGDQPAMKELKTNVNMGGTEDDDDLLTFDDRIDLNNVVSSLPTGNGEAFSQQDSQDELSALFNSRNDSTGGAIGWSEAVLDGEEHDKKIFSNEEDEHSSQISQLRQLLNPTSSAMSAPGIAAPNMSINGSAFKRRVSFMHQQGTAVQNGGTAFQTFSVPPSPGARARQFNFADFTPISPHQSQPSSAVQSPFISPRSTPTAQLFKSRHDSGTPQNRSRHPSTANRQEEDNSLFLSPRSRHGSGNCNDQQQQQLQVQQQRKPGMVQAILARNNSGPTTVAAAGNEFLRRRHFSALASTSAAAQAANFVRFHQRPVDFIRQCPPPPSNPLEEEEAPGISVDAEWLFDAGRARSVPVPVEIPPQPVNSVYSSGPGTPVGQEIAAINANPLEYELNLHLFGSGSVDSGFESCTSERMRNLSQKSDIVEFVGANGCNNFVVTSRSYPNTPLPGAGPFWSQNTQVQPNQQVQAMQVLDVQSTAHSYPSTPIGGQFVFDAQQVEQQQQVQQQQQQMASAPSSPPSAVLGDGQQRAIASELAPIDDEMMKIYMDDLNDYDDSSINI